MVRFLLIWLPKKNDVSRTTIIYWIKKYSTLVQQNTGINKLDEIKKFKERIEELEVVKGFQLYIIADMKLFFYLIKS